MVKKRLINEDTKRSEMDTSFVVDDNAINNKELVQELDTIHQELDLELDVQHLVDEIWKTKLEKASKKPSPKLG